MVRIIYENETTIEEEDATLPLLATSLKHGIPHVHACGGHARCSTCRVIVLEGLDNVLPRNAAEQALAGRKGFEPNIRLACQTRVKGPVRIRRLVLDEDDITLAASEARSTGRDIQLAVLFSDLRDFTGFAENQLPYDVVHLLNRYFWHMGNAILSHAGYIDKYSGDGIMALFGIDDPDPTSSCRNAVRAALEMQQQLEIFNRYVERSFRLRFRMGIGVHFGEVILGEMGHPDKMQFTAIGDTVNVAARIESATREAQAALLVSEEVYRHIRPEVAVGRIIETGLKGKPGRYPLYEVLNLSPPPG